MRVDAAHNYDVDQRTPKSRVVACWNARFISSRGIMIRIVRILRWSSILLCSLQLVAQNQVNSSGNPVVDSVTARLKELTRLPAEAWRYHLGDIPHGEDVGLDDSNWTMVRAKSQAPQDAVWYRRWVVVPATLKGYD